MGLYRYRTPQKTYVLVALNPLTALIQPDKAIRTLRDALNQP